MSAKASDINLLGRIAAGEEPAFSQLFTNTCQAVYRYLMRVTGNRDAADQLLIQTYQTAWVIADDYNERLQPANWLVMIAREQVIGYESGTEDTESEQNIANLNVGALDRQKVFVQAMESLPVHARDSLTLVLMQSYTYHAISEIMGVSIDDVKTRVFDAKNKLKEKLKRFGIKKHEVSRSNILRELIPLYINGALSGKHKVAFEKSLKNDPNLKQEYMEFYEIEAYFDHLESVSKQHLDQLYSSVKNSLQDLDEIVEPELESEKLPGVKIDFLQHLLSSSRLGWGLAILQFAVLVIVLIFIRPQYPHPAEANIAAAQLLQQQQQQKGRKLNVIFQDKATHKQIRDLLLSIKAEVFAGPTNIGLYTISVDVDEKTAEKILDQLRKNQKVVLLADPAY